jgi:hypothetical protein
MRLVWIQALETLLLATAGVSQLHKQGLVLLRISTSPQLPDHS